MNSRILKCAMAAIVALSFGNAQAQAARTGGVLLYNNEYGWANGVPGTTDGTTGTFHAGGVAACDGCHVMHNASKGVARSTKVAPWTDAVPAFLLQGSDQSSTCLMCHGDTTAGGTSRPFVITNTNPSVVAQMNYSPGGDFGWLKSAGSLEPIGAMNRHGHNVAAADFGMGTDTQMRFAPGGTYTSAASGTGAFACSSCHDPHGRYRMQATSSTTWTWAGPTGTGLAGISQPIYSSGSYGREPMMNYGGLATGAYRLLAGRGYVPASSIASPYPFVNNPPVAIAPANYNHTEAGPRVANEVRVAYGSGMSEWCQNCHTNIHLDNYVSGAMGFSGLRHPAGQGAVLKVGQYDVYNTYVRSGRFDGSNPAGENYTSLVPFENAAQIANNTGGNIADIAKLKNAVAGIGTASIFVATGQSNVMCLSCHRAHASAFSSIVRWNADDTFITDEKSTFVNSQGRDPAALTAGYYGRAPADFGVFQRSLCNKCHGKD